VAFLLASNKFKKLSVQIIKATLLIFFAFFRTRHKNTREAAPAPEALSGGIPRSPRTNAILQPCGRNAGPVFQTVTIMDDSAERIGKYPQRV